MKTFKEFLNEAKDPKAIKSVASKKGEVGVVIVTTNDGEKYEISAKDTGGKMPKPGESITKYVK